MFTGIISHIGKVKSFQNNQLLVKADRSLIKQVKNGDSVAVNGVCLTVIDKRADLFQVEVMPETLKRTALGGLKSGDIVNLELAMKAADRFAGHIVQGHIDGVATVKSIKQKGNSRLFTFEVPKQLGRYIVEKGSIAVNGISLTVIDASNKTFTVGIIPYTWRHTMLSSAKVGDWVNIEVDILAKYLEKLEKAYHA
ncbi:riboflavin synthase subunit alpha [Candidatus Curtissbacteria bacterium RIFCSPHIGHO2_12_41_11]|uniref:Riboflavin synthase n=1 Tax=Candidatus Curtissbacteria bacterium RIFCSPHIGHO2_12_41_11 TaxID=1797718 RepID=A0A1F5H6S2_9BACT|nr:MAG: riboflavin synthase subunit alpha [Candidatus Curtissbacteria bacterium RIFCSPHIGHO2_12_41_11]